MLGHSIIIPLLLIVGDIIGAAVLLWR